MTDAVLLDSGMNLLVEHFGLVEAERFLYLVNRDRFDYTRWHGILSEGKTIEEIAERAMQKRKLQKTEQELS
jgi:heme oxygenase